MLVLEVLVVALEALLVVELEVTVTVELELTLAEVAVEAVSVSLCELDVLVVSEA